MKMYLKTHLIWLLAEFGLLALISTLLWLDGYRGLNILLYALVLVIVLTIIVIIFDYSRNKSFYQYLENGQKASGQQSFLVKQWQRQATKEAKNWHTKVYDLERQHQEHIKFMNIWVHQMKTPLSVLELMAESNQLDALDVLQETDRLKGGLNTALNYTRLDDFTEDFVIEEVALSQVLKKAISVQRRNFIRHEVFPQILGGELMITTDRKWLGILLDQLISNGIKYSPKNSKLTFEILPETQELVIRDVGVGIAASDLPRVFRPFFTGENGRKFGEATGMGLYLVKVIAEHLAIKVAIASVVDQGTTITLTFQKEKQKSTGI